LEVLEMATTSELEKPQAERAEKIKVTKETSKTATDAQPRGEMSVEQAGKHEVSAPEGVERTRTGRVFTPAVDIYETPEAVVLVADMPGVDEKSADVTLEKNVLTIYGRVDEQYPAGHSLAYSEYRIGDYQRSFNISNAIDWGRISGTVRNGVLKLTLPKAGPAKTRKIDITSA
jgi:HSP20 family molecular chaperone IbpA